MSSADPAAPEEEATETDERREALLAGLAERLGDDLLGSHIQPGHDLWIRVAPAAWARLAASMTASNSISLLASTPVSKRAAWGQ